MPVYADCDYCGKKNLIGHLKYYRFCEKKFCSNCHLKYQLPHLFHEIEDYQIYVDRTDTREVIKQVEIGPPKLPENLSTEIAIRTGERLQVEHIKRKTQMILDEVAVPKTGKELYEEVIKQENNIDESSPEYIETRKQIKEGLEQVIDRKIKQVDRLVSEYQEEQVESSVIFCPKCQSKMIIEIQTEFEVEETEENTGLIPAYECHDCEHIWPVEVQVESPKKEEEKERFIITAFNYKEANLKYRSSIGDEDIWQVGRKAIRFLLYHNVDFVVIAKMKRSDD